MEATDEPFESRVKIRRHWKTGGSDTIRCYASMEGRVTLGELIQYFSSFVRTADFPLEVALNFATAVWDDQPTQDELDQRAARIARSNQRHEEWERETYQRLKAKFEGIEEDR